MAQSPIYIILNGASETGKSTLVARGLMDRFRNVNDRHDPLGNSNIINAVQDSFANPMKHFIATTLGVKYAELKKNTMMAVLQGYTPREFLIHLSEHYIKERYGDDAYGRWLVHRVLRIDPIPDLVIIDDGGFQAERDVLGAMARVVRVTRSNKTFEGDSRMHLPDPHYTLSNDGTVAELEPKLDDLANWCIDQLPVNRRPKPLED